MIVCQTCGSQYTDEEFLAAHLGPFAGEAVAAAKQHGNVVNCANCPTYEIEKSRPT